MDLARQEVFWSSVEKTDGCWLWLAGRDGKGYGAFKVDGKTKLAHRIAYELTNGELEGGIHGQLVLHECDNPRCVRPDHMFVGSHQDNVNDKVEKGRQATGETHGSAKLSAEDIQEIRRRYQAGGVSQQALADAFGVSQRNVSSIVRNKTWAGVTV